MQCFMPYPRDRAQGQVSDLAGGRDVAALHAELLDARKAMSERETSLAVRNRVAGLLHGGMAQVRTLSARWTGRAAGGPREEDAAAQPEGAPGESAWNHYGLRGA